MVFKGKGKLKEKVIEPLSSDAFVEVPLNQTLETTNDVRRERNATTPLVFSTFLLGGVRSTRHGSFSFLHPTQV
jgi:hypothetical protein